MVVETHVSVLVFFDEVVVKYKKPLCLPFLDFTSRESRLAACLAEVEANRRLSPDVYLGVADLKLGDEKIDHAVLMRRLPQPRRLDRMIANGEVGDSGLDCLAQCLAQFHSQAARSREISEAATGDLLRNTLSETLETLRAYSQDASVQGFIDEIGDRANKYLDGRYALFESRISSGRICDGHGDLLATDVFLLEDAPRILDCIEFDPALRHVDVVADLAFLLMDLEHLGAVSEARKLAEAYRRASGDDFPPSLLDYYCAQKAAVRAAVASIRGSQERLLSGELEDRARAEHLEANRLLQLALHHLRQGEVSVGVVCGLPGTGKSTLASTLADRLGWDLLRSDEIRREMPGSETIGDATQQFGVGAYTPQLIERTYREMLSRARSLLGMGHSVVLDATFNDGRYQSAAEELASATSSRLAVIECRAPLKVASARADERLDRHVDLSTADSRVVETLARKAHPWALARAIDTSKGLADYLDDALAHFNTSP